MSSPSTEDVESHHIASIKLIRRSVHKFDFEFWAFLFYFVSIKVFVFLLDSGLVFWYVIENAIYPLVFAMGSNSVHRRITTKVFLSYKAKILRLGSLAQRTDEIFSCPVAQLSTTRTAASIIVTISTKTTWQFS